MTSLVHLNLISGVGPQTIRQLIGGYGLDGLDQLYVASAYEITMRCHLTSAVAALIVAGLADKRILDEELELLAKHHCRAVTLYDGEYPELLKQGIVPPTL